MQYASPIHALDREQPADIVVVAGFGSPHGDDQAGWQVLDVLDKRRDLSVCLARVTEGTQLINKLDACQRLIVVDACCSGSKFGAVTRFEWPDPRIRQHHNHSTHGIGLCNALILAERLCRLPARVQVFGIEIGKCRPLDGMTAEVMHAVGKVATLIRAEISEATYA